MPRAGIGAVSIPPLVVLEATGLFPGASEYVADAVTQLRRRRDELVADGNAAARLARRIGRTMPLAYGGGDLGAAAARRFKTQCNENAKVPAFWNTHPELCHNEICGWGQHGDVTRQTMTVVEFRHDFEHPQVMRRFDLTRDLVAESVAAVEQVRAEGEGSLAQLLDLVIQGDFASLHLAVELDVDPGPVPVLDDLKAALAG
jgi:glucose/mannose-6-phosphate isomerase